ncbi:hypothetical protein B0J13DRAFT_125448 [Dactylonectria estremocensis]|uniref:Uncharacterized protein n=1 Tax=Dactylonectria estremocensis TaxID=1079267 RepID=A0A9P9FG10_9HYPO|nr:hypothetical protein B0J13DRAFT_125448 [Dactylonectria estremocensis]
MLDSESNMVSFRRVFTSESMSSRSRRWVVDDQESCILYAGRRLPAEVRLLIFSFVLQEVHVQIRPEDYPEGIREPNWLVRQHPEDMREAEPMEDDLKGYDLKKESLDESTWDPEWYPKLGNSLAIPGGDWPRPDTPGRVFQHTTLLRTCRRVFNEARDILMRNATIRLFEGTTDLPPNRHLGYSMDMFTMSRYTANRITSFCVHTPVTVLEHGYLYHNSLDMCAARDIRLVIRQGDWWKSAIDPPQITPYGAGCVNRFEPFRMREHMELTKNHGRDSELPPIPALPFTNGPRSPHGAWGAALSRYPRLMRFTIDFEYNEDKFDNLLEVAEWAHRVWRFRLGGNMKGYYLTTDGIPIKKSSWRALSTSWTSSQRIHNCREHNEDRNTPATCCANRSDLLNQGIGPRMYRLTVSWEARKLEREYEDDPSILGPEELSDRWNELPVDGRSKELSSEDWLSGEVPGYRHLHPNCRNGVTSYVPWVDPPIAFG